jgi:hypothetical protein
MVKRLRTRKEPRERRRAKRRGIVTVARKLGKGKGCYIDTDAAERYISKGIF